MVGSHKTSNKEYRDNYDRIFGKKELKPVRHLIPPICPKCNKKIYNPNHAAMSDCA